MSTTQIPPGKRVVRKRGATHYHKPGEDGKPACDATRHDKSRKWEIVNEDILATKERCSKDGCWGTNCVRSVSEELCRELREQVIELENPFATELAREHGISDRAARKHIRGECSCEVDVEVSSLMYSAKISRTPWNARL